MATESIPKLATYIEDKKLWVDEATDGKKRWWFRDGELLFDAGFRDGQWHGNVTWTRAGYSQEPIDAAIEPLRRWDSQLGRPLLRGSRLAHERGELLSARFFGNDQLVLSARWRNGKLHGTLNWLVKLQINFSAPVLSIGDKEFMPRQLKLPKPHPARAEIDFLNGVRGAGVFFNADGEVVASLPPISDWGQEVEAVEGYIARGDLERDVEAFYADVKPVKKLEKPRTLKSFIGRVPESQRAAVEAFDALVRGKRFPALLRCFDVSSYGFDCVKNELYGAADARYVGLSSDGSGNMHLLDTETGQVLGYEHEEGRFDEKCAFQDLDAYAFTMIRVEAVAQKRIDPKELTTLFERLGLSAGLRELAFVTDVD